MLMDELAEDPVWRSIAKVCMAVALIAVLFNMTTQWELEGHFQTWSFVRKSIAKVVSSGTVWAGVAVYAGWKLSRPTVAFLGGIVASVATLFIHYVVGGVLDFVTGWVIHLDGTNDLLGNLNWFAAAALLCGPLGLVGWMAAKPGGAGAVARCVVPVGALLEPFVMGCFSTPFLRRPWAERYSDYTSGVLLVALGLMGVAWALWPRDRGHGQLRRPFST